MSKATKAESSEIGRSIACWGMGGFAIAGRQEAGISFLLPAHSPVDQKRGFR